LEHSIGSDQYELQYTLECSLEQPWRLQVQSLLANPPTGNESLTVEKGVSLREAGAQSDKNALNIGGSLRNLEESSNSYYFSNMFSPEPGRKWQWKFLMKKAS
jgi:hypothetical protein